MCEWRRFVLDSIRKHTDILSRANVLSSFSLTNPLGVPISTLTSMPMSSPHQRTTQISLRAANQVLKDFLGSDAAVRAQVGSLVVGSHQRTVPPALSEADIAWVRTQASSQVTQQQQSCAVSLVASAPAR